MKFKSRSVKPGDVLRQLVKHPEIVRRRAQLFEAAANPENKIRVTEAGWFYNNGGVFWTTERDRMDLLTDPQHCGKCVRFVSDTSDGVMILV